MRSSLPLCDANLEANVSINVEKSLRILTTSLLLFLRRPPPPSSPTSLASTSHLPRVPAPPSLLLPSNSETSLPFSTRVSPPSLLRKSSLPSTMPSLPSPLRPSFRSTTRSTTFRSRVRRRTRTGSRQECLGTAGSHRGCLRRRDRCRFGRCRDGGRRRQGFFGCLLIR